MGLSRSQEESIEKTIGRILDREYYQTTTYRPEDKETQIKGIDVVVNGYNIDEKAAITYINKELPTFAIEIALLNKNGEWQEGWYTSPKSETDIYTFVTDITAENSNPTEEQIKSLYVCSIKTLDLKQYFQSYGWDSNKLLKKAYRVVENASENVGNIYKYGLKFKHCHRDYWNGENKVHEESVVAIIPMSKIREISFKQKNIRL